MKKDLKAIDTWLNKTGNTKAILAGKLGYTSSHTIQQWFRRQNIPTYMRERVREIIK